MRQQAIFRRILIQLKRDKRTLALIFIAPLALLTMMYFLFQQASDTTATVGYNTSVAPKVLQTLKQDKHVTFIAYHDQKSATQHIKQADLTGFLTQTGQRITMTYQNADQSKTAVVKKNLQVGLGKLQATNLVTALQQQSKELAKLTATLPPNMQQGSAQAKPAKPAQYAGQAKYVYSSGNATFFTTMLPVLMGFVVFFFVFLISGMSLLGERSSGTLERVLATPVKRWEVIAGYTQGYGLFAVVQTLLVVLYVIYGLRIEVLGSVLLVGLIDILIALVALSIGLFVSTFAASEFQMVQFIPILIIPQVFFAGIVPVENMAGWLQVIAHIMPLYYGANGLSAVIAKGAGIGQVWLDVVVLLGFFSIFTILNINGLKRYRKI